MAGGSGVWVYQNGDINRPVSVSVKAEYQPFGLAIIPNETAAWVTFSGGMSGDNPSYLTKYELNAEGKLEQAFSDPIPVGSALKAVDADQYGNAWFVSLGTDSVFAYSPDGTQLGEFTGGGIDGPWGISVDGDGNIWVANFGDLAAGNNFNHGRLTKLCGANPDNCPPGLKMGDPISPASGYTVPSAGEQVLLSNGEPLYGSGKPPSFVPMMRQTSAKIDAAGNVWTINNWKPRFDIDILHNPGGDGIIIFVGLATPVGRQEGY